MGLGQHPSFGNAACRLAAAVNAAAPIPRLAHVMTATRLASQCIGSPTVRRPGAGTDQAPVQPLVSVQAPFQVEMALGMIPAGRTRSPGHPPDGLHGGLDVTGRRQETGHTVRDHLTEDPAPERHDGIPARPCLGGGYSQGSSHRAGNKTTAARAMAIHSDVRALPRARLRLARLVAGRSVHRARFTGAAP